MIQATEPLATPFLRIFPQDWKRPHLEPLTPTELEIMGMLGRVLRKGWGPRDSQAGKRLSIPISPKKMAKLKRKSESSYRKAIASLLAKNLLDETGKGPHGVRFVRPSKVWITRHSTVWLPSGNSDNSINSKEIGPFLGATVDVLEKTEAPKVPIVTSEPTEDAKNRKEFASLVRIVAQTHGRDAYAVSTIQLREHSVRFLLPIWREATSPTSGVSVPLAWIKTVVRKRGRGNASGNS